MGVHLFAGLGSMGGPRAGSRLCGYGPPLQGSLPLPATKLLISGVTKDSSGICARELRGLALSNIG
jgi:hypothetical protein